VRFPFAPLELPPYRRNETDWNNLPWDKMLIVLTVLVAGPGIIVGIIVPAIGQMVVASAGLKAISRQPEAGDRTSSIVLLSLAMLESLAIFGRYQRVEMRLLPPDLAAVWLRLLPPPP